MITPWLKTLSHSYISMKFLPDSISLINNMLFIPYCIPMYLNIIPEFNIYTFQSQLARKGIRYSSWMQDTCEWQSGRGTEGNWVGSLELSQTLNIHQHKMTTANHQTHVLICFDFHCKSAQFTCSPTQLKTITWSAQMTRTWGKTGKPGLQRRRF